MLFRDQVYRSSDDHRRDHWDRHQRELCGEGRQGGQMAAQGAVRPQHRHCHQHRVRAYRLSDRTLGSVDYSSGRQRYISFPNTRYVSDFKSIRDACVLHGRPLSMMRRWGAFDCDHLPRCPEDWELDQGSLHKGEYRDETRCWFFLP